MTTSQQITISAYADASPSEAWNAYTSPAAITQWNQASSDWHCPSAEVDLRVGGRHVVRMEARDGSFGFDFAATYEEVNAPRALTLRLDDDRRARTTFEAEGNGTRITTVFDAETTNPIDMQRDGWQAILESYVRYLETSPRP
jgi:uncharacterized protein YndB with AHSA1/START domain